MTTSYLPLMTANNAPAPFAVSASSNISNAFLSFNNDLSDFWSPTTTASAEYLEIDLVVATQLNQIRIQCDTSVNTPTSITLSGANTDYPTFTTIQTFTGLSFTANNYTVLSINTGTIAYRYYRIILTNQNGANSRIQSVLLERVSNTISNRLALNSNNIIPFSNTSLFRFSDLNLYPVSSSFTNYLKLRFFNEAVLLRPVTGQIFPRGYPVEKANIVITPIAADNLTEYTGGTNGFIITQMAGINSTPYTPNLTAACGGSYFPTGSFCNQLFADEQDSIWKFVNTAGATWNVVNPTTSIGVLVLDLGSVKNFNSASVFQMFADGKITHIQLFTHPSSSNTAPIHTDSGWQSLGSEVAISAGATGYNGVRTTDLSIVSNPTKINISTTSSRYLKLHCRNSGVYGNPGWIELGGFKLFNL